MSDIVKIYGIKNCDTVKKALKFLANISISYEFIDYRENPISENLFERMKQAIGLELLINKRSTTFRSLTDSDKQNIDYQLVTKYPTLIKRPVLIKNDEVIVGFSDKKYSEFLL
ncbi:MAG: Spx/MgsR family RNA polymerase-binding regulatory protein [Pseudomonadota bacterium]|nr:Spx/MgsR family RNA polymerase-binding regulatory protein [Pseudomonadota bacterium]